jgi:exopolysaccharide biosynthesis polyprenyl glycosylphosphotransferase
MTVRVRTSVDARTHAGVAAGEAGESSATRRRPPARGGFLATREMETTLYGVLALGATAIAVAAFAPSAAVSLPASVAAVLLLACAAALLAALRGLSSPITRSVPGGRGRRLRAAVIGPVASALDLKAELLQAGVERIAVVGAIVPGSAGSEGHDAGALGTLADLGPIVKAQQIDLLVTTSVVSCSDVVTAMMSACEGDPVRLYNLSGFYEDVFGRVPVSEIDSGWFQYVLHPRFTERRSQRIFDLLIGSLLALLLLPLLCVVVLLILAEGGPVLFPQRRIGEHGRTFVMYKFRTMRCEPNDAPKWASADDPRVTSLGRILRRTHVDELPQIFNVLLGDMALVGPRPEQPAIAARLEESLPFWRARYRHKPGLTGWAQVRSGYARSEDGSAWKLAHDLYYLRHQSLALDMAILIQTASTLLFAAPDVEHIKTPFIVRHAPFAPVAQVEAAAQPIVADLIVPAGSDAA